MAAPLRLCAFASNGLTYSGGGSRQGAKTQRPLRRNARYYVAIYFSKTISLSHILQTSEPYLADACALRDYGFDVARVLPRGRGRSRNSCPPPDVGLLRRSHAVLDVVRVIVVEDLNPAVTPPLNDANPMG